MLPDSTNAREDFEWLKAEIEGGGGQAAVFAAHHIDSHADAQLIEEFRQARQTDYMTLAQELDEVMRVRTAPAPTTRRQGFGRPFLHAYRQRLAAIEQIDFFGSAGRDRVVTLLDQLASPSTNASAERASGNGPGGVYRRRVWVTRTRPGVDRMSSAWLIRRFIDPEARFAFVKDGDQRPADCVPFDMFGVEFSHQGAKCTFETLCEVFSIAGRAISRLAAVVHDLDLKDGRFGAPEAVTVGAMIDGLQLVHAEDDALLEQGMMLFESLYRAFDKAAAHSRPRAVARAKNSRARKRR